MVYHLLNICPLSVTYLSNLCHTKEVENYKTRNTHLRLASPPAFQSVATLSIKGKALNDELSLTSHLDPGIVR